MTSCVRCGSRGAVDRHHLSGRPEPGAAYFDPGLVVDLCRPCHAREHAGLRRLGLDFASEGGEGSATIAHRLRRVAVHVDMLADADRPLALSPGAARALADCLRGAVDILTCAAVAP